MSIETRTATSRALIVAVQLPDVSDIEFESSLKELGELARTLGFEVVGTFTQKRTSFDAMAYVGAGKREEMRLFAENNADFVLVDHDISPSQAGNLEKEVGCQVMDRAMVILEIFHRHARSNAARAQVEIARLRYLAPRLREAAKLAGPQGRQRSGVGGRGAGESAAQTDRSRIRDRIAELKQEIEALDHERQTQRARRQDSQGVARVALVGYTNAGKSTLMRALTGSDVLVENKLFATLDTTVRVLVPEGVPRVLVSDTVGFIKNLPHDLVASFKSTLEEAAEASLLLHVVDAGDPGFERQLDVTVKVLEEIDAGAVPRLLVFNKIDQVGDAKAQAARSKALRAQFPKCIVVSALDAEAVARLHKAIFAFFRKRLVRAELFLPWSAQKLRGPLFSTCEVVEERPDVEGTFFTVRGERKDIDALREQIGPVKKPQARAPETAR
ncbi:MAG: GTPase HflX [bacterium]|jgi:GTP-binding protein HflX|nr:GTPase HflX [Rhodocyclaceae bacterium]MCA4901838.1 GTPase HflX [Rhodocyclaceae bacterium]